MPVDQQANITYIGLSLVNVTCDTQVFHSMFSHVSYLICEVGGV
jgi:hypothetical protein